MKTMIIVVCGVLLLGMSAAVVFGQMMQGGGSAPMLHEKGAKELTPEQFTEMKARVLKHIDERKARLDQEKACVEASKNAEELRKCRPEPPRGPLGQGRPFPGTPGSRQQPGGPPQESPR